MSKVIILNGIWDIIPSRTLGPYLLRHILDKRGYDTQVIDHCQEYAIDELYPLVNHFIDADTLCIGASSTFWTDVKGKKRKNSNDEPPEIIIELFNMIKKLHPHIKIVVGGAGIRQIRKKFENIDYFVLGSAEDLFPEILDHLSKNSEEPVFKFYKNTKIKVYTTPIDKKYDIGVCDFNWHKKDCIINGEALPIEFARGCIFKCSFCSYPYLGKKKFDYLRNLEQVKEHMISNYNEYGITNYIMVDDTFNDSEYKIDGFLEMTKSLPFKISYWAYIRADLLHSFKGQAEKLHESGLSAATMGIETLGTVSSQIIGKGWSGKHAREYMPNLIHNIWQDDVNSMISIIVGLPGDTTDTCNDTYNWIVDNNLNAAFTGLEIVREENHALSPFLSEFEKNYRDYGIQKDETGMWFSNDWNRETAIKQAIKYTNSKPQQIHSMLQIYLRNYGYSHEELLKEKSVFDIFESQKFKANLNIYMDKYKSKLLSL